jgi:hypothetical protein
MTWNFQANNNLIVKSHTIKIYNIRYFTDYLETQFRDKLIINQHFEGFSHLYR